MTLNKFPLLISILSQGLLYGTVYFCFLRLAYGPDFSMLSALWLLLPIVITTVFLKKAEKGWQFFLLHGIFFFLPALFAKDILSWVFYSMILLALTVLHYVDTRAGLRQAWALVPRMWQCLFYAILACYTLWQKEFLLYRLEVICFAAALFLLLLYHFQRNVGRFFSRNREIAELPEQQIQKVTGVIMLLFFSVLIMSILLVLTSGLEQTLVRFAQNLWEWLRALLLAIFQKTSHEKVPGAPLPGLNMGIAGPVAKNPAAWVGVLLNVILYLVTFIVGIAILVAVGTAIYRIVAHFRNELPDNSDRIEFLTPFVQKESLRTPSKEKKDPGIFDRDPNSKIRKIYRKTILSHKDKSQKLPPAYTPSELEQAVSYHNPSLHTLYEKARYSEGGCSQKEAELARNEAKS